LENTKKKDNVKKKDWRENVNIVYMVKSRKGPSVSATKFRLGTKKREMMVIYERLSKINMVQSVG